MGIRASGAVGLVLSLFCANAWGAPGIVTVRSQTVTTRLFAYARVVPITVAKLRTAVPGIVAGLSAIPGQHVEAGAVLGRLQGPEIAAELARRRGDVASAAAAQRAAQGILKIGRENRAVNLSTRQSIYRAQQAAMQAQAQLATAQAALDAATSNTTLRAPATGAVIAVMAADGERVAAGQTVLSVQPDHRLWVSAVYYGTHADSIHVGLRGQFTPAARGAAPIAVVVSSVLPAVQPGGGLPLGLRPVTADVRLVSGEAGTLVIEGGRHQAVPVPTRALILDRGRWWVLVHTPHGDRRQAVTPGVSRGDQTMIENGLKDGTEVVVTNAYLEFHRNVAQHYQPPD